jgi:hypothetical protein
MVAVEDRIVGREAQAIHVTTNRSMRAVVNGLNKSRHYSKCITSVDSSIDGFRRRKVLCERNLPTNCEPASHVVRTASDRAPACEWWVRDSLSLDCPAHLRPGVEVTLEVGINSTPVPVWNRDSRSRGRDAIQCELKLVQHLAMPGEKVCPKVSAADLIGVALGKVLVDAEVIRGRRVAQPVDSIHISSKFLLRNVGDVLALSSNDALVRGG